MPELPDTVTKLASNPSGLQNCFNSFIYCRSGEEGFNPLASFSDSSAVGAQSAIFAVTKVEFCMQTQGPRRWDLKNTLFLKAL